MGGSFLNIVYREDAEQDTTYETLPNPNRNHAVYRFYAIALRHVVYACHNRFAPSSVDNLVAGSIASLRVAFARFKT